MLDKFKKLI